MTDLYNFQVNDELVALNVFAYFIETEILDVILTCIQTQACSCPSFFPSPFSFILFFFIISGGLFKRSLVCQAHNFICPVLETVLEI